MFHFVRRRARQNQQSACVDFSRRQKRNTAFKCLEKDLELYEFYKAELFDEGGEG